MITLYVKTVFFITYMKKSKVLALLPCSLHFNLQLECFKILGHMTARCVFVVVLTIVVCGQFDNTLNFL